MSPLFAILVLAGLFGIFAAVHLWAGDSKPGACTGNGDCGNCHGRCEPGEESL